MQQIKTAQRCVHIRETHVLPQCASVARCERSSRDGFQSHPRQCFKHYQQYDEYTSLAGTLDRFKAVGLELVEMVLANQDSWDRYEAAQWWTFHEWMCANPDDPDLPTFRATNAQWQHTYLTYGRRDFGWGVFVLKVS